MFHPILIPSVIASVSSSLIFQSPRAKNSAKNHWTGTNSVTRHCTLINQKPGQYLRAQRTKIIGPYRSVNSICSLSLYTHIPNIKSIPQSIAKQSGDNCFTSELWNDGLAWVILYFPATQWQGHKNNNNTNLKLI